MSRRLVIAIAVLLGSLTALALSEAGLRVDVAARGWTPNGYVINLSLLAPDPEAGYALRKSVRVKQSRSDLPAITHSDYSARVQTVDRQRHPRFHALLKQFYKQTGCPVD